MKISDTTAMMSEIMVGCRLMDEEGVKFLASRITSTSITEYGHEKTLLRIYGSREFRWVMFSPVSSQQTKARSAIASDLRGY